MQVEFVGQSARDSDNIAANPSRLVNCYREPVVSGGRAAYVLKSVLGTTTFSDLGADVRAMGTVDGDLYAVAGGALYSVSDVGVATSLGAVADGDTTIAGNNSNVTIAAAGTYRVWNGTTLLTPTAGAFSDFGAVDYIGNYTVLTERNGRKFQWSDVADPTDLPGLNFSTADGRDDNLLRPFALNGVLYLFKETSHEIWYLTGSAGASAFERQTGGVYDIGLKSFGLLTRIPSAGFFVGSDNRVYLLSGQVQPVSIPPVETSIKTNTPEHCFAYEDEGHTFCVITFADRAAWVYDLATGEWHERAEGADLDPWTATCAAKFGAEWYCGKSDGKIYRMERTNADDAEELVREATSRTLYNDAERLRLREVEMFPRQGFSDGQIMLSVSRNGGLTWSSPKVAVLTFGQYAQRVIWREFGQSRQFTVKVRWTDPDDVTFLSDARVKVT